MGAVLRQDQDPQKQLPLANVSIAASGGTSTAKGTSDSSGLFKLTLLPGLEPGQPVLLRFEQSGYSPIQISGMPSDQLYIVHMTPTASAPPAKPDHAISSQTIKVEDVRIRYSLKEQITVDVGSVPKQFEVANAGNVPCDGHSTCSPDGKWKAAIGAISLDAEKGNEFRNVRVSCIGGPCPFTKIEVSPPSGASQKITVSALNWSDTAAFLVEAEVKRVMVTDTVRWSYPFIVGQTMSFSLPAVSEGPSIAAALNAQPVVFPLGPNLLLSWATCSLEIAPDRDKIYRCELKPGYQFRQQ